MFSVTLCLPQTQTGRPSAHRGFVYMRPLPERGGRCTPGIPMLLWKQGFCSGQWQGRDYDMCLCVRINQTAASIWQRVDTRQILISSLMEENMLGNNTGIKQTHGVKPIKDQQSNLSMKSYEGIECMCVCLCTAFCYIN